MNEIKIQNIQVFAYHGCLAEERIIGSDYLVNISVYAKLQSASQTDALSDTVDYVHVNRIVKLEMAKPSNLLETVASRIINRIFKELHKVQKIKVEVSKLNPPIQGDVKSVSVILKEKRT